MVTYQGYLKAFHINNRNNNNDNNSRNNSNNRNNDSNHDCGDNPIITVLYDMYQEHVIL